MRTEESNIYTQAIFFNDSHRLLLKKVWNKDLSSAAILMSNAGVQLDINHLDYTGMFCCNELSALGYGSCTIVNLFSKMTTKLHLSEDFKDLTCPENMEYIVKTAEEADVFILAVGSICNSYKKVGLYMQTLYANLRQYQDKIHVIEDSTGAQNLHPLARSLRGKPWKLVPYKLPAPPVDEKKKAEAQTETETQAEPIQPDKSKRSNKK